MSKGRATHRDIDESVPGKEQTLANNISPLSRKPESFNALHVLNACRTLVLDCSYCPIDVINWQRAVCLDLFEKADVLSYYRAEVRAPRQSFPIPAVVQVRCYVRPKVKELACIRRNILIRDSYQCQYCGSSRDLTIDHVHPASRGGEWRWENLVACCTACNARKGSKTLAELGWRLGRKPKALDPGKFHPVPGLTQRDLRQPPSEWADYLVPGVVEKLTMVQ